MANLRVDKITSTETFDKTGSVQFGSGRTMKLSANSGFDLTDNDFTIECWMCMHRVESFQQLILYTVDGTEDDTVWQFDITSTQLRFVAYVSNSSEVYGSNFSFEAGTWYHIAATRTNGLIRLFVDGDLIGTHPFTATIDTEASAEINIGFRNNQGTADRFVNGHLSNIRIIKGKALYTADFKPPMKELEVTPETTLLCCQSKTDPILEKTGKTITITGNLSASELTPGILTPIVKSGGGSAITGSVEFDGTGDYMQIPNSTDLAFGTGDFTLDCWIYANETPSDDGIFESRDGSVGATNGFTLTAFSSSVIRIYSGSVLISSSGTYTNQWNHIAVTRYSGTLNLFINGISQGTSTASLNMTNQDCIIGGGRYAGDSSVGANFKGFLSNLRVVKGTALYTADFIPPTRELKKVPGTVLLCCQDSNDPTQEVTGKTISLNGIYTYDTVVTSGITTAPGPSNFTPQVGDDRQITFEGVTKIDTDAYFYLPTGDTTQRGGTFGIFGGGYNASGIVSPGPIDFINIQSQGNAIDFGDLSVARQLSGTASSRIRGLFGGGNTPSISDVIDFVTFSTQSNATDFGNLTVARVNVAGTSSDTRGLFAAGQAPGDSDVIDYVTIASTGNATDFGNLQTAKHGVSGCGSQTRGIFAGGYDSPSNLDVIGYVTIASTGNALDFGNLTTGRRNARACSSHTRGIFGGGNAGPAKVNTIDFITIATTGDATDFGDLITVQENGGACSSLLRGVFAGGNNPSYMNTIEFVTMETTGNASDFGDLTLARQSNSACSNGHGGLG